MRTVFFGTPELAVPTLQAVAKAHTVTAVVCQPDKPQGRSKKLVPPPVKVAAETLGIPVHQPSKLNDGRFERWLQEQAPEVCTVAAYGRMLKQPILDIPPKGWLNVHPSLLPRWRGASPIQTALLAGDTETGVSIMRIVLEMDAGDVLLQERVPINPEITHPELSAKLAEIGARLMVEGLDLLAKDQAVFTPQDPALVTHSRIITKEDGRIDWTKSAWDIHNQVRALQPWPIAYCQFRGQTFRILRTKVLDTGMENDGDLPESAWEAPAGSIVAVRKNSLLVATGSGILELLAVQAPGKRVMNTGDFLRGHRIEAGERLA